jgi:hypothetical protein
VNANYQDGFHIRRASDLKVYNSVVVGWTRYQGFGDASITVSPGQQITAVKSDVVATNVYESDPIWVAGAGNTKATALAANCPTATNAGSVYRLSGLQTSAWTLSSVNFTPLTAVGYTNPLLATGVNATGINAFFTTNATTTGASTYYRGARRVADDNGWNLSSGWVNWQPETAPYENDGLY